MTARITPAEIVAWRQQLVEEGDGDHLDPAIAHQIVPRLLAEVEQLQADLAGARREFARTAASALGKRLADVAVFNRGGFPSCYEAEAREFLAKLQRIGEE